MTTIFGMFPEIVLPEDVIDEETSTPMRLGTSATGGGLLPALVVQFPPQAGGDEGDTLAAKPLNPGGAGPPLRLFFSDHCELHQVSVVNGPAPATVRSPRSNAPRDGNAKTTAVCDVSDDAR